MSPTRRAALVLARGVWSLVVHVANGIGQGMLVVTSHVEAAAAALRTAIDAELAIVPPRSGRSNPSCRSCAPSRPN